MKRTAEEVASTIQAFVSGTGKQWDWDGFTSIRLDDPELEEIRKQVIGLPTEFPPANPRDYCGETGMEKMGEMVAELRRQTKPEVVVPQRRATRVGPTMGCVAGAISDLRKSLVHLQ